MGRRGGEWIEVKETKVVLRERGGERERMEGKIEGRKGVSNRENQREERECGRNHIKRSLRRREEGRTCAWCCGLSWF